MTKILVRDVARAAAKVCDVSLEDITGNGSGVMLWLVRCAAWNVSRNLGHRYPMMGSVYAGRDRTTICRGVRRARENNKDPAFASLVIRIQCEALNIAQAREFLLRQDVSMIRPEREAAS